MTGDGGQGYEIELGLGELGYRDGDDMMEKMATDQMSERQLKFMWSQQQQSQHD